MSLEQLFTELLHSKKISGPRLLLRSLKENVQRKRSRTNTKVKNQDNDEEYVEKNKPSKQNELSIDDDLSRLGIVQKESGLEYHPESITNKTTKKKKRKTDDSKTTLAKKQKEMKETQKKTKQQTVCKFYKRGRCTKKDCEFLHEGPPPLCFNILKDGYCNDQNCIYNHDSKSVGCMFFHITHNCSRGDHCKFSHDPIPEEQLNELKRIHEEIELEKQSSMPAELAKAMISDIEKEEKNGVEEVAMLPEIQTVIPTIIELEKEEEKKEEVEEEEEDDEYY